MYEKQPILKSLIEQGYIGSGKIMGLVINEKAQKGVALIKLESIDEPFNIYWNKDKKQWQDVKPASIIKQHYGMAV